MKADYVKPVALAYGGSDPNLAEVVKKQLDVIGDEQQRLQDEQQRLQDEVRELEAQAAMIRQLATRASGSDARAESSLGGLVESGQVRSATEPTAAGSGRLPEDVKEAVRRLYTTTLAQHGRELSALEIVERLEKEGFQFPVAKPSASVGTVLIPLRKAHKSNGQLSMQREERIPQE